MPPALDEAAQHLLRELAPQVLGILLRRYRDFPGCEDAVQESLIAAASQWPREGVPDNARGWLIKVATRRLTDQIRADTARRLREQLVVSLIPPDEQIALAADASAGDRDETLDLYFMCCHPALTPASQTALTLRAIGGLTTGEIARAFHVPETTMAQRISRAKQTIKSSGKSFEAPTAEEEAARLPVVLRVLYLIFNEGYTASTGDLLVRVDLSTEAIRVARLLRRALPDDAEVAGLLALMLLTDARREARVDTEGLLVPLDEQDRQLWRRDMIREGTALLYEALAHERRGVYQVQAAIAALHNAAPSTAATDWPQILALYGLLVQLADSPMARLSRSVALAMVEGPIAGLREIDRIAADAAFADHYRLHATRGHLLERAGRGAHAAESYRKAAERTSSTAERHYLLLRAARLSGAS